MCGRYVFVPSEEWKKQHTPPAEIAIEANYNVAPMQKMPIITGDGVSLMQWGLVPSWSKEFKPSFTAINARAETAAEKPLYREPFKNRRCLVPASGFYEWQQRPTFKQPYLISLPDRPIFNFAGLYDVWYDAQNEPRYSYTILTTEANSLMADVYNRMPVILDPSEEDAWLEAGDPADLQLLLDPYDSAKMSMHEVARDVGNVKNNHEKLLLPLNSL